MNQDFRDLLSIFNHRSVEYIVVGAHALAAHGHIRATKDLDIWVRPSVENARRILVALAEFGAPISQLSEKDLASPGLIFQIGVPPVRIDVITKVDGLDFAMAWQGRLTISLGDLPISVLSRDHLIINKRASGRLQDLADLEVLEHRKPQE
jgi:hypothetical protein